MPRCMVSTNSICAVGGPVIPHRSAHRGAGVRLTLMQTDSAADPGAAPNQPPACSLAAFEPSLHFVDLVHALDDDAAGRGGDFVLEGAEADADVDAPFDGSLDGLRVHVVLL